MIMSTRARAFAAALALTLPAAVAVTTAGPAQAAATTRYTYVDLGVLGSWPGGETYSHAFGLNQVGQVVGYSTAPETSAPRAFVWQNGSLTNLGSYYPSRFAATSARSVNGSGDVVGHGNVNDTEPPHALLFRHGQIRDLGTGLGPGSGSYANDINDAGVVVGGRYSAQDASRRAAIWQNGKITGLGSLGGHDGPYGTDSEAYAINENGQVVGAAKPADGPLHGFLWNGRRMRDIGTLGGDNEATIATDINDVGQITGNSPNAAGQVHAFLWQNGAMRDLGAPAGVASVDARAANNHGQVVGSFLYSTGFLDPESHLRAAISVNGVMTDLQPLVENMPAGITLWTANDINDDGVIVGATCIGECYPDHRLRAGHAFMLVPKKAG